MNRQQKQDKKRKEREAKRRAAPTRRGVIEQHNKQAIARHRERFEAHVAAIRAEGLGFTPGMAPYCFDLAKKVLVVGGGGFLREDQVDRDRLHDLLLLRDAPPPPLPPDIMVVETLPNELADEMLAATGSTAMIDEPPEGCFVVEAPFSSFVDMTSPVRPEAFVGAKEIIERAEPGLLPMPRDLYGWGRVLPRREGEVQPSGVGPLDRAGRAEPSYSQLFDAAMADNELLAARPETAHQRASALDIENDLVPYCFDILAQLAMEGEKADVVALRAMVDDRRARLGMTKPTAAGQEETASNGDARGGDRR